MRRPAAMVNSSVLRSLGRAVCASAGRLRGPFSTARGARPAGVVHIPPSDAASPTFVSLAGNGSIWSSRSSLVDREEWEGVREEDVVQDEGATLERYVFGRAPSRGEAEDAVEILYQMLAPAVFPQLADYESKFVEDQSEAIGKEIAALNSVYDDSSSEFSEEYNSDWIEPAMQLYASDSSKSKDEQQVYDALTSFRTDASLQRVVVSISSDKAVWDAVINNQAVQELRKSMFAGSSDCSATGEPDEHASTATGLKWFFINAKTKITEFIFKITQLARDIFPSQRKMMNVKDSSFDGVVRSSLMISMMVFMVVILNRLQSA